MQRFLQRILYLNFITFPEVVWQYLWIFSRSITSTIQTSNIHQAEWVPLDRQKGNIYCPLSLIKILFQGQEHQRWKQQSSNKNTKMAIENHSQDITNNFTDHIFGFQSVCSSHKLTISRVFTKDPEREFRWKIYRNFITSVIYRKWKLKSHAFSWFTISF